MTKSKFGKPLCRLIIAVAIMMLSLQAMAYDFPYTHQGKTLYYNIISDSTVEVTYYNNNDYVSGDVVIPSTVTYNGTTYSVTSIGSMAFNGCSGLTSVTIGNSVTSIGDSTFSGCSGLTSVSIPNSVTYIGYLAFLSCSGLTSINVASGNTHYSSIDGVLYNYTQNTLIQCPGAKTSITIGNNVTSIGGGAFEDCSGLTTLNFNAINCQDFDYAYAPFGGTSLTTVNIGDSVQRIPANFVRGCSSLTSVTIGNNVTSIGGGAFEDCSGLTTLNFNARNCHDFEEYRENGNYYYPFSGTSLTTVNIGDSVKRIPKNFVKGCSGLTSLTIGIGVTSIGRDAFEDCSGLTTLNFNAINCQDFSSYYSDNPFNGTSLTTVNIGDSVQRIPANFVSGCRGLTSITIPTGVTSIGYGAFYGCSGLTSVTIPNSVTSIGGSAFYNCRGLTSVTSPTGVTSIEDYAFYCCSGLTSVTIPNSVTSIKYKAFSGCSGLTSVTIPTGVTSIEGYTFYGCSGLTSVTIPTGVTSIGGWAFSGCSGLTSVTIPTGVTSIGKGAFVGCSGLTTLNFNARNCQDFEVDYNNVYYYYPFSGTSLTTVNIGDSVQHIPANFVRDCNNLSSITSLAMTPPTISSNNEFPYPNICTVTVPCGSLEAYTASTCYWSVYFPQRITAGFPFELNASANDSTLGTVVISTGESCAEGVLTAIPELCYRFVAWNDGNTTNPRTITLTQDTTLTANFERAVYTQAISHAICEGSVYTENGFNVSEPGTYTQNLQTVNGCDSVVTLTLTVNPVASTNLTAAICEGSAYTENGFNVSEAGTHTLNLQTINGCDSIVTLTLTVNPVANTTLSATICEGSVYTENGFNVSEAGSYTQTLQTVNGCDSIVTLNLTVNPVESTNLTAAICEGTTYTENGFNASEAGTYTQNLQTINGCDSVVTLTLTVNPTYNIIIDASINEGETYEENGFSESEAGTYVHTLQSEFGCDSVITLNLTVNSSLNDVVANAIEVSLYPNPANAYTTLKVEGLKEETPIYLFDIQGRKLKEYIMNIGQETLRIDLGDLPKGVYTIMLGNTTKKLIVE